MVVGGDVDLGMVVDAVVAVAVVVVVVVLVVSWWWWLRHSVCGRSCIVVMVVGRGGGHGSW